MVRAVGLIDPGTLIQSFLQGRQISDRNRRQGAVSQLMPAALSGDEGALGQLSQVMPELAMQISGRQEAKAERDRAHQFRVSESADAKAWRKSQAAENKRRWQAQYKLSLDEASERAAHRKLLIEAKKGAKSKIGKLSEDFKNGFITEEQFKSGVNAINAPGIRIGDNGRLISTPLNKAATSKVQKEIVDDTVLLDSFKGIRDSMKDEYLTFKGQMKGEYEQLRERAEGLPGADLLPSTGPKAGEFIAGRTEFKNQVQQAFNAYRKLITGAAAAVQELNMLQQSFLSDKMSPSQFKSALNVIESKTRRAIQVRKDLLGRGIDLGSEEAGQVIDSALLDRPGMPKQGQVLTGPKPWERYQRGQ